MINSPKGCDELSNRTQPIHEKDTTKIPGYLVSGWSWLPSYIRNLLIIILLEALWNIWNINCPTFTVGEKGGDFYFFSLLDKTVTPINLS
jgi:hypothetical protein